MLSPSLDFTDFIHRIADRDYRHMIAQAERECDALEAMLDANHRPLHGNKAARAGRYLADIGQFLHFLRQASCRRRLPTRTLPYIKPSVTSLW